MLILNGNDIKQAVSTLDVMEAVEKAFLLQENGNFIMPHRMHIEHNDNVLLLMPALSGDYFSTKLVSVFPNNTVKNEPIIYGSVILNDGNNGKPIAFLDGSMLTALRTGAIGGLGVVYTTPKNVSSLGLIGAGYQGFHQVLFACSVRNITEINLFDPFNKDMKGFVEKLSKFLPHIQFKISESTNELVLQSEVIITATTSNKPVIADDAKLLKGKHFIGVGSFRPEMQEFPNALYSLTDKIIIDTPMAKKESGDINSPLQKGLIDETNIFTLGKVINQEIDIDTSNTTFFKSVGMALFDLLTAEIVYRRAQEKKIGTIVEF